MSALQRIHARTILSVNRETADVLRLQAKKVAMFEHELFEDYLDLSLGAQYSLSLRYRAVFELIDAVSWDPATLDPAKRRFKVPMTEDLINLLGLRRDDLEHTVKDRLNEHGDGAVPPEVQEENTTDSLACVALDWLFRRYARVTQERAA